jgi:hypothetical protein
MESVSGREWWAARRLRYNIGLVFAGAAAFVAYAAVLQVRCASILEGFEITAFTIGLGPVSCLGRRGCNRAHCASVRACRCM